MLKRSFVHLPGVGRVTEKKLWYRGIRSWEQLDGSIASVFKPERARILKEMLDQSARAYRERDLQFFSERLPKDSLWRLIPEAPDRIAYLDIETTGLGFPPTSHSTTVTFYFRGEVFQEHEPERKRALLRKILGECLLLSTYFGEAFDVPFLEREFGIEFNRPHLDLCFWLKRLGYRGGLKKVQRMFPDIPARTSLDIDGYDAVRLWRMHERGVGGALETLLAYNAEDTVVLEPLLVKAYNLEVERHAHEWSESAGEAAAGNPLPRLTARPLPALPTRVDPAVYQLLRSPGRMAAAHPAPAST